jgi:hypothetical protein
MNSKQDQIQVLFRQCYNCYISLMSNKTWFAMHDKYFCSEKCRSNYAAFICKTGDTHLVSSLPSQYHLEF